MFEQNHVSLVELRIGRTRKVVNNIIIIFSFNIQSDNLQNVYK